jgi:hypothetical protein
MCSQQKSTIVASPLGSKQKLFKCYRVKVVSCAFWQQTSKLMRKNTGDMSGNMCRDSSASVAQTVRVILENQAEAANQTGSDVSNLTKSASCLSAFSCMESISSLASVQCWLSSSDVWLHWRKFFFSTWCIHEGIFYIFLYPSSHFFIPVIPFRLLHSPLQEKYCDTTRGFLLVLARMQWSDKIIQNPSNSHKVTCKVTCTILIQTIQRSSIIKVACCLAAFMDILLSWGSVRGLVSKIL